MTVEITDNGITVTVAGKDTRVNVSEDSSTIQEGASEINFKDKFDVTDASGAVVDVITNALDSEEVQDEVNNLLEAGDKLSWTYDDANGTLTIDTTALDTEEVEDAIDSLLVGGNATTLTYDDAGGTLTIAVSESAISHDNISGVSSEDHHNQIQFSDSGSAVVDQPGDVNFLNNLSVSDDADGTVSIDTSGLNAEEVEDQVNTLLSGGTNITTSYDDANDTLTINAPDENIEDVVNSLLIGGTNVSLTYDDANDILTIDTSALDEQEVKDEISATINASDNLTKSYDGTTLTLGTDALDEEEVEDAVNALLVASDPITLSYDDAGDSLTIGTDISLSDGGAESISNPTDIDFLDKLQVTNDGDGTASIDTSALDTEEVEDAVNALISDGNAISTTYDDAGGTLTIAVTESDINTDNITEGTANLFHTDERAQDAVGTITSGGDKITVTYDDANDTLTIDTTALDTEEVEDQVNSLLVGGTNVSLTYDDANDTLTIDSTEVEVQEDGTSLDTDVTLFDFVSGLTASSPASGEIDITVNESEVDHDSLNNFVSNEHIDHSNVNITAGSGLTGGGDITSSRTLNAQSVSTQTTNYTASENDIVLADASGGAITITLPSASTDVDVVVKKTDSSTNDITVATPNTETIDGESSITISDQYTSREITSDGSNYYII